MMSFCFSLAVPTSLCLKTLTTLHMFENHVSPPYAFFSEHSYDMSSLGFISISAITLLASPRPVDPQRGTRNIIFDANFYIVDGSQTSSLGLLRYFAPDNTPNVMQKFSQDTFQKAFIIANVCLSDF